MDASSIASALFQGVRGQQSQPRSIGDRISQIVSTLDDAVSSGALSSDQAARIQKVLDGIAKVLDHNSHKQNGSSNGARSPKPLSQNDRRQINSELRDIERQLSAALHPRGAAGGSAAASRGAQVADLFKAIDTNSDGSIGKDELAAFVNGTVDAGQRGGGQLGTYSQQGTTISISVSVSITQSQLSITV